ncbi:OmpP1/FadL family transporter [Reichenbachiella ulvae]|uniref:Outer membrane protein transport protein (OMPP1/FadL/TodX) n=1 Tax=Reichenbachiella ulvae TaxID=2980104 RepID=A0ABT3CWB8_9BACT|nr:hypothetical protein [Reichenbachiella ulvae]MCV9388002.1 hypothetical protein [Reichenbachiella ulvae]
MNKNTMSRQISILLLSMIIGTPLWAQNSVDNAFGYYNDALLFSRTYTGGSARMQGIGGAQVSLGSDINAAYVNPAGLGSLLSSGITFTPSLDFSNTESKFMGNYSGDFKGNFNFANLGMALHFPNEDNESGFKGLTFAITLTRENNFHQNYFYDGFNDEEAGKSSIVDSYLDRAWGLDPDDLGGDLLDAYDQYLINPEILTDAGTGQDFTGYYKVIGDFPRQIEKVRSRGAQYEWDFALGANFMDKIYFGGALGINTIRYYTEQTYSESEYVFEGSIDEGIDLHSRRNTLKVDGTGVSGTFGMIVRPIPILRLGATIKTPTLYGMREETSDDFLTLYNNLTFNDGTEDITLDGEYYSEYLSESRYSLTTPWKLTTGGSLFLGKIGFLSADIEFMDYSQASVSSNDFIETDDNNAIKDLYQNTINLRFGGEFRINQFMIRGGYNLDGDPYKNSAIDNSIQRITGGIGYRNKDYFVDLAVVHTSWQSRRSPYTIYSFDDPNLDISPTASIDHSNVNVSVTFGVNF